MQLYLSFYISNKSLISRKSENLCKKGVKQAFKTHSERQMPLDISLCTCIHTGIFVYTQTPVLNTVWQMHALTDILLTKTKVKHYYCNLWSCPEEPLCSAWPKGLCSCWQGLRAWATGQSLLWLCGWGAQKDSPGALWETAWVGSTSLACFDAISSAMGFLFFRQNLHA